MPRVGADQQFYLFEAVGLQFIVGIGPQLNGEAPARHAQSLDFLFHGAGEAAGGLLAQVAEVRKDVFAQAFRVSISSSSFCCIVATSVG